MPLLDDCAGECCCGFGDGECECCQCCIDKDTYTINFEGAGFHSFPFATCPQCCQQCEELGTSLILKRGTRQPGQVTFICEGVEDFTCSEEHFGTLCVDEDWICDNGEIGRVCLKDLPGNNVVGEECSEGWICNSDNIEPPRQCLREFGEPDCAWTTDDIACDCI